MPVFNDFSHYYTPTYSSSGYSSHSSSTPYSTPYSPLLNRPHSNYLPSNYPSSNLLSTITGSGITARYYTGNAKNNSNYGYNYKGTRTNYNDPKTNAYSPSPYTTYSLWKENQIASKWRKDNYRWNQLKDAPRTTKPVFIDTAKINVNKPRIKRQEPTVVPEPIPERSALVEKPMVRDEQLGTIKRGRTVVRMHTKMLKENPYLKKKEKSSEEEEEDSSECRFNRMSPVRISRLKKRSVLQYKRHDSGNKHWLDSESSDNESSGSDKSMSRKSTVKSRKISRSGTIKRDDTIKNKEDLSREDTVKRRYNKTTHSKDLSQNIDSVHKPGGETKKTDRRLSLEMYEEQTAILDSMIKAELAREDADDYFSDPKRGTVKIKGKNSAKTNMGQSTDSNTDEEDIKKKARRLSRKGQQKNDNEPESPSEKSTPSSSRRNSLFQDLIIGETISETFIEDLENKIQNSYTNSEKILKDKMPKLRLGTVKITQKLAKKPSRFDIQPSSSDAKISAIVEVEEKPKTPKFFIEAVKIEASKFSFEQDSDISQTSKKDENIDKKPTEKVGNKEPIIPKIKKGADIKPPTAECNNNNIELKKIESMQLEKQIGTESKIDSILKNDDSSQTESKELPEKIINSKSAEPVSKINASNGNLEENGTKVNKEISFKNLTSIEKAKIEITESETKVSKNNLEIKVTDSNKQEETSKEKENKTINQVKNDDNTSAQHSISLTSNEIITKSSKVNETPEEKAAEKYLDDKELTKKGSSSDVSTKTEKPKETETKTSNEPLQKPKSQSPDKLIKKEINKTIVNKQPNNITTKEPKTQEATPKKVEIPPKDKEVNKKTKSPSPEIFSAQKPTDKVTKDQKSISPDKNIKKDANKTGNQSESKEERLEEKPSSIKTKINLESNKKTTKMKEDKSQRKTVKSSGKDLKSEKTNQQKVERVEEKSEQPNHDEQMVQVTAKKSAHRKKESSKPRKPSAIVHMKPRAMAIRTVENHPPSLKTPRLFPLPQPTKAVIEIIPATSSDESSEESDDESTATEGSSDECSETSSSSSSSSSSLQGNLRNSTSSLDSGFGSACYKTKKGIALQLELCTNIIV